MTAQDETSRAVILTVDDDPGVSRAVARDLRRQYGARYRIVRAESARDGLDALRQMKLVATGLFLAAAALYLVMRTLTDGEGAAGYVEAFKRSDFGMKYGLPVALSDEVKLEIAVEAYAE